jgi:hypothetical protein
MARKAARFHSPGEKSGLETTPEENPVPDFIVSCDLGQAGDFTAVAVLRRSLSLNAEGFPVRDHRGVPAYRHAVAHLERFPLGTSYRAVVASVSALVRRPELRPDPRVVIDATGVGRAVAAMFLDELHPGFETLPLTITAGDAVRRDTFSPGVRGYWVPKAELVSAVQAALNTERLKVARGLAEGDTLRRELLDFKVKVTASARETFNAREGAHDDLVLAVAMGVWLGGRRETSYRAEAADDPDRRALTAEREKEERAEAEALERERRAERERREREWLSPENDVLWTRIG